MKRVNIYKNLFELLLEDYNEYKEKKDYQNQFRTGMDFLESSIKFFAVLNISVLKSLDKEAFEKIIVNNLKEKPSLGDFKSLAVFPFGKKIRSSEYLKNEFYLFLENIFKKEKINLEIDTIYSLKGEENKKIKLQNLFNLFEQYLVSFRNHFQGHSASFRIKEENEKERLYIEKTINVIGQIVDKLNNHLIKVFENIYFKQNGFKITAEFKNIQIDLLPLIAYIPCNKYSCCLDDKCNNKKVRVFFFNEKDISKINFLDYGYNHFYNIKDLADNEFIQEIENLLSFVGDFRKKQVIFEEVTNETKHLNLLDNFVGREEELKKLKSHIFSNISQATFTYITGKPGIGKSALVAKLVQELKKETGNLETFIFYAQSSNMGGSREEELNTVYSKIESVITAVLNLKGLKNDSESVADKFDVLFKMYEKNANNPLLIIMDGLDEFKDWQYIIENIPMNFSKNIHLVFTSRDYSEMKSVITKKAADYSSSIVKYKENDRYYLQLDNLKPYEVEDLISIALPKEIKKREDYNEIIQIIKEKSESLPLYLDYLMTTLKNSKIKLEKFKKWSKKLPEGIDEFYNDSFNRASNTAMKILKFLYLTFQNVYKRDIKVIFKDLNIIKDYKEFEKAFNEIEIFLYETDGKIGFYHQSVSDAIEKYLNDNDELFILENEKIREILYIKPRNKYIYLDKRSETFTLLETVIRYIKGFDEEDIKDLQHFYNSQFYHMYYQYIHFKIYQSLLGFDDVKNGNYYNLVKKTGVDHKIKQEIEEFLKLFDSKQNKFLFEIKYAYELSFLIKNYKKVLKYMELYQDYIYDKFFEIVLNINKPEYIREFIKHKNDWINNIPQELKDFFIEIIAKQEHLSDEFVEVMEFLDDEYKVKLIDKIDVELALGIVEKIKDKKIDKNAINLKIIENKIKNILDEGYKNEALKKVIKIDDIEKIIKKNNNIKTLNKLLQYFFDVNALTQKKIITMLINNNLLHEAFIVAKHVRIKKIKLELLLNIAKKTKDIKLLNAILESIKTYEKNDEEEFVKEILIEVLLIKFRHIKNYNILNDIKILINKNIKNEYTKWRFLLDIAQIINDQKMMLSIFEKIDEKIQSISKSNFYYSDLIYDESYEYIHLPFSKLLIKVIQILIRQSALDISLSLVNIISIEKYRLEALSIIINNVKKKEEVKKIINIIKDFDFGEEDYVYESKTFENLLNKIYFFGMFYEFNNFINSINQKEIQVLLLLKMAQITKNKRLFKRAFLLIKEMDNEIKKYHIILKIIKIMIEQGFIKEVLVIINKIYLHNINRDELYYLVIKKIINQQTIENILLLINKIENSQIKLKSYSSIIEYYNREKKILKNIFKFIKTHIKNNELKKRRFINVKSIFKEKKLKSSNVNKNCEIIKQKKESKSSDDIMKNIEIIIYSIHQNLKKYIKIENDLLKAEKKNNLELYENILINSINEINKFNIKEVDVEDYFSMIFKVINKITKEKFINKTLEIFDKSDDVIFIIDEYIENYDNLNGENDNNIVCMDIKEYKLKILIQIAKKTKNITLFNKAFKKINEFSSEYVKEFYLNEIISNLIEINLKEEAYNVLNKIKEKEIKIKLLFKFALLTNDRYLIKEILLNNNEILYIFDYNNLIKIMLNFNDEEILHLAIKYIVLIIITKEKIGNTYELLKKTLDLFKSKQNLIIFSNIIENPLLQIELIRRIHILETLDVVSILSPEDVLEYFEITESKKSGLDIIIEETKEKLKSMDKKEQRNIIRALKEKFLSDETILNEFIEKYGDKFDIEDRDDFIEEFTFGNFKKVFIEE